MKPIDGGPAFPRHPEALPDGSGGMFNRRAYESCDDTGMSLRDWIAGTIQIPTDVEGNPWGFSRETIGGLLGLGIPKTGYTYEQTFAWDIDANARLRYLYADAMLKARELVK